MYDLGVVSELVPGEKLLERAREIADSVMQMSPLATRAYLEGAWQMREDGVGITAGSAHGHALGHGLSETEDYSEGPRSFVEKRRPVWKAR
jgi:crotonobetainyl-CoA hydratase